MTDLTLIFANLFSRKLRAILMIVAIFFAFLIFGMLSGVQTAYDNIGGSAGENRLVVVNKINFTQPLPISYVDRVRAVDGVQMATYANWFGGYYQDPKNLVMSFAVDPESYLDVYADNIKLSADERAAFLADRTGLLVGRRVAEKQGWKVGDRVPLNSNIFTNKNTGTQSWDFTIRGIFDRGSEDGDTGVALFHHAYFNESVTFSRDMAGYIILATRDKALNTRIAQTIDEMFANSPAETATDTEKAFTQAFASQLGNITLIITMVVGAAFATILMIVGNTMVMAVRERTREIGVMKTLGFPSQRIFRLVLGESVLLAALGAVPALTIAGVGLGMLRKAMDLPGLQLSPSALATGLGLTLALGLITGFIPAWNALRLNIVTALGRS